MELHQFLKENYEGLITLSFVIISVLLSWLVVFLVSYFASGRNLKIMYKIKKENPDLESFSALLAIALSILFYLVTINLNNLYWELEIELQQFIF